MTCLSKTFKEIGFFKEVNAQFSLWTSTFKLVHQLNLIILDCVWYMIHDMLSIILANKALAVSVKFSNSAYDVTVMYNYNVYSDTAL